MSNERVNRDISIIERQQPESEDSITHAKILKRRGKPKQFKQRKGTKRLLGWKLYFWILAIYLLAAYGMILSNYLTTFRPFSLILDLIDIPVGLIALLGLFGFAYQKRIFFHQVWRCWFFIAVSWDLFYNIVLAEWFGIARCVEESNLTQTLISLMFLIPEYVALYRYGYRSNELWDEGK